MSDEWISVRERLPKRLKTVLVFCCGDNSQYTCFYSDDETWIDNFEDEVSSVTHWRELPPPPEPEDSELVTRLKDYRHECEIVGQAIGFLSFFGPIIELVRKYESEVKK